MKKRLLALLLALLLVLSCLTGCSSKAAEEFYQTGEEMAAVEDALVDLVIPYHGANLLVNGFICRSSQTADLIFTLEGAGAGDGIWTELRVDGNQLWVNVDQAAERTLAFDLPNLRRQDMELLQSEQRADWVSYTWKGDFWAGIPGWGELLRTLWENCKPDLNGHISGGNGSYTLELSGRDWKTAAGNLLNGLLEQEEAFQQSFQDWADQQSELVRSTQLESDLLFENVWAPWTEMQEAVDSQTADSSLTLTLSKSESSYGLAWTKDGGDGWSITVTPTEAQPVTAPDQVMEFGAYANYLYYLLTFSNTYISDVLEGVGLDPELESLFDGTGDNLQPDPEPMETGALAGYDDLQSIQFIPQGGQAKTVPILSSYLYNSVSSEDGGGAQITELTLQGDGWYQAIYAEAADGRESSAFLTESISAYYDAYVNISGYLLVQDLSRQISAEGGCLAQGFSYREDDYSEPVAQLMILMPREGNESYTVLDLELRLAEMSQADKDAVGHLFDYLGLELPVSLET